MKILIVKFSPLVLKMIDNLQHEVVAVCDPDINGRLLAKHELPWLSKCYADSSQAMRESDCDTVLLTISDHAPQLAILAIAYKKDVLLAKGVRLGKYADRIYTFAAKAGRVVSL